MMITMIMIMMIIMGAKGQRASEGTYTVICALPFVSIRKHFLLYGTRMQVFLWFRPWTLNPNTLDPKILNPRTLDPKH